MKRFAILAAALVALAVSSTGSHAGNPINISGTPDGRLTWVRGISDYGLGVKDSTRISIAAPGAAVDFADTTKWVELTPFRFNQAYTAQPLVWFEINMQGSATADSVGYRVQTSDDISATDAGFDQGAIAYTVAAATTTAGSGLVTRVVAAAPTSSVFLPRFVRLIVYNADVSGATGRRYFSAVAMADAVK